MTPARATFLLALGLGLLASGLRFHRLGDWPFAGDELATIEEVQSLFGEKEFAPGSQAHRLPRLIPLAYATQRLSYAWFGADEFGSRVLQAALGTLGVVLAVVGIASIAGRPTAAAAGLLLALWPDHVFQCQQNRFYVTAWVCATAAMLLGAAAVRRRSAGLTAAACAAATIGLFAHTLLALLFVGLGAGTLAAALAGREGIPWRRLGVVMGATAIAGALGLTLFLGLGRGWNTAASWGYSVPHSVLASVNQVGWPTALLALLGCVEFLRRWSPLHVYWLGWVALWGAATVALPLVVAYHPSYVFPLTLGVFVAAGSAVGTVYRSLRTARPALAALWVVTAAGAQLPALASHYADGSRFDYRAAAAVVRGQWRDGDRVAAFSPNLFRHYLDLSGPVEAQALPTARPVPALEQLSRAPGGRLWVVVAYTRGGLDEELRRWLDGQCRRGAVVRKRRFDHNEYVVEVYRRDVSPLGSTDEPPLIDPPKTAVTAARPRPDRRAVATPIPAVPPSRGG